MGGLFQKYRNEGKNCRGPRKVRRLFGERRSSGVNENLRIAVYKAQVRTIRSL